MNSFKHTWGPAARHPTLWGTTGEYTDKSDPALKKLTVQEGCVTCTKRTLHKATGTKCPWASTSRGASGNYTNSWAPPESTTSPGVELGALKHPGRCPWPRKSGRQWGRWHGEGSIWDGLERGTSGYGGKVGTLGIENEARKWGGTESSIWSHLAVAQRGIMVRWDEKVAWRLTVVSPGHGAGFDRRERNHWLILVRREGIR